ncbi:trypsin-like serine peptidase [Pseudanabaena mucicola]|uniref:Trypsin-like peptidase domain-containing protein n=1 Tax=Pseudanabaena mucicola FACHB-723 TaxID=2692860 RepID=A0ABR8A101_9CYAN|nr:trypsin-like serine protease [Pseudanabaena mucicola]MBD2189906.1 trypsin-like peptidase domain-containing protein [Pseudanabaena mucicola FACHB-723]
MKYRIWKNWFGVGMAMACLSGLTSITPIQAQSLSGLLPKNAIAPQQIDSIQDITDSLDGFTPEKLRESESPVGNNRAIIGEDQRVPLLSREYPWSTVGKVVMVSRDGKEYSCTGTLIGKSLVLTNAHCVYDQSGKLFPSIFFLPNLINGRLRTKNDAAIVRNILAGTNDPIGKSADDWAILQIDKPLGEKYGFLRWRSVPSALLQRYKNKLAIAGYSGDYPDPKVYNELSAGQGKTAGVHIKCSILGEREGMLVHDCDTNPGASGSALITKIDGVYQIVGLHAAGQKDQRGRGIENYAVRIGRIEADLKKGK